MKHVTRCYYCGIMAESHYVANEVPVCLECYQQHAPAAYDAACQPPAVDAGWAELPAADDRPTLPTLPSFPAWDGGEA